MTDYQFYSLIISTLTAFGTIGSVIVSLYLASKYRKVSLKLYADIFLFQNSSDNEYFFIQVVNKGNQTVYIKNILLRYGLCKKKCIPISAKYIYDSPTNFKPPFHKLEVGQVATLAVNKSFLKDIYSELLTSKYDYKLWTLEVICVTTLGDVFKTKIKNEVKKVMKDKDE